MCRTYTGDLNGNLGQRTEQGLPTSARLTAVQKLSLGAERGSRKLPSSRGAPPPTPYRLFGSLVFFSELSISPEAFLGCPQQWDPSAPHSGALGLAPLFPLTSSQLFCFCVITFSLKCELHQTAHTSLLSPGSAGCMQMPNNACRMAGAQRREVPEDPGIPPCHPPASPPQILLAGSMGTLTVDGTPLPATRPLLSPCVWSQLCVGRSKLRPYHSKAHGPKANEVTGQRGAPVHMLGQGS